MIGATGRRVPASRLPDRRLRIAKTRQPQL
jgi:hypothetical protein